MREVTRNQLDHFLSEEEISVTRKTIDALQPHWIRRDDYGLFTLGAASYIDNPGKFQRDHLGVRKGDMMVYRERARASNPLLLEQFGWLYEKLKMTLSKYLGEQVCYYPGFALPGFHIFQSSAEYQSFKSHIAHFDHQYLNLDWGVPVDMLATPSLSYTLAIELPQTGGGMRCWDIDSRQIARMSPEETEQYIRSKRSDFVAHAPGRLIVHSGNELHRVSPWKGEKQERRITLQGHGIYIKDAWQLYW